MISVNGILSESISRHTLEWTRLSYFITGNYKTKVTVMRYNGKNGNFQGDDFQQLKNVT